jgi:uncharacterized membrane protein YfcA
MESAEMNGKPGLAARLVRMFVFAVIGAAVGWRGLCYDPGSQPYPLLAIAMCASLAAVLYTLSILALVGRSNLSASPS